MTFDVLGVRALDANMQAVPGTMPAFWTTRATGSLQTWAMIVNPFFSPVVRLQPDCGHRVIAAGPYRFMRHPGYLAMLISIPASALAIGSFVALIPAIGFAWVIHQRTRIEDQFLKANLPGYAEYTERVPAGLPFMRSA
jgi:protein-S-isoprenylcysteine O-methyltransferase Ste14